MLRHPSAYIQRAFSLFISLGHHHSLLRRQSQEYQTRRRAGARAGAPPAGLPRRAHHRILVLLAGGSAWLDAAELAEAALADGVVIEPGKVFFMDDASAPRNFLRIGFTSIRLEQIDRASPVWPRWCAATACGRRPEGRRAGPRLHNISSRR